MDSSDSSSDYDFDDESEYFYRKVVAYQRILWTVKIDKIKEYYSNGYYAGMVLPDDFLHTTNFRIDGYKNDLCFHAFLMDTEESEDSMNIDTEESEDSMNMDNEQSEDSMNMDNEQNEDSMDEENSIRVSVSVYGEGDNAEYQKYDDKYEDERLYNKYYYENEEEKTDYNHGHQPSKVKCYIVKNDEKEKLQISYPDENYDDCYRLFGISADKITKYSENNRLNLMFEFKFCYNLEKIKFKNSFEKFYNKEYFNNFKIICCDGVEVPVNSMVLAQFSPVFETMFNSNLMESKNNEVKLDDLDGVTMSSFVKFLYTGKIDNLKEVVLSLMYAAEKYEVTKLKEICVAYMKDKLSVENVFETFNLAELCTGVIGLRSQCIEFMKFKYELLKDLSNFKKLSQDLVNEIVTGKDSVTATIKHRRGPNIMKK